MISITNSYINNKLVFVKNPPSNYVMVEYLESDGNTYIDTGLKGYNNMCCEVVFSFNELPNDGSVIGSRHNNDRFYFFHYFQGPKLGYGNYYGNDYGISINTPYKIKTNLYYGEQSMYINDELIYRNNLPNSIRNDETIYAFGLNNTNTFTYGTKCKIYYIKLWYNNVLIGLFLPCYDKNDNNIPGLYNVINNEFKPQQGEGIMTVGGIYDYNIFNLIN